MKATFDVRPVSARPLKSAMDTLRPHLTGSAGLDLFCGYGRFGLGALHEGADSVTFVDTVAAHLAEAKRGGIRYGQRAHFEKSDAFRFLASTTESFDIVFADPPFPLWNSSFETTLFSAVLARLKPSGIFLVKHPEGMLLSGVGFSGWKTTRFGESALSYFIYGDKP